MRPRVAAAVAQLARAVDASAWLDVDAADLLAGYARGDARPSDVVEASLRRIEALDPVLRAVWAVDDVGARAAASRADARWRAGRARPLEGVPVLVKDLLDVADLPATGGSRWLADRRATVDAEVVANVRAAGAIVIGKSATFELGCGDEHTPFGVTRNPHDPAHTTGGSSSGSAAALAARLVPLALGTDTGGSIRIPAAWCGVVGLKPTLGRLSTRGLLGLSPTLDTPGPMARSARDVALLLAAMLGHRAGDVSGTGASTDTALVDAAAVRVCDLLDDDVRVALDATVASISTRVGSVAEVSVPGIRSGADLSWLITMAEAASTYADAPRDLLTAAFAARVDVGVRIGRAEHVAALRARTELAARVAACFEGADRVDVLVMPTTVCTAPPLDHLDRPVAGVEPNWPDVHARNVAIWNVTGLPALTVPIGSDRHGLPIGLQLVGAPFADERILAIAAALAPHWNPSPLKGS